MLVGERTREKQVGDEVEAAAVAVEVVAAIGGNWRTVWWDLYRYFGFEFSRAVVVVAAVVVVWALGQLVV